MRILGILCIVLAVLVVAFFVAPASLMGWALERATDGRITVSDTEGTLWRGSGFISVIDKSGQAYALTPEPLVWTVERLPLLWGEVAGKMLFDRERIMKGDAMAADFRASSSNFELGRLSTPINLPTVLKLVQGIELLDLGGQLSANIDRISWQSGVLNLDAAVKWDRMRSALSPLNSVGDYVIRFQSANRPVVDIVLETVNGPLMLSANGQWTPGEGYHLEGHAETDDEHVVALQNMMMVLGVDRGGKRHFRFASGG